MSILRILILIEIIVLHLSLIAFSASQLYYGDEVSFVIAAKEISQGNVTGHFSYDNGKISDNLSNMLMHPPTYIYLLSLSVYLFGDSLYSIRLVSAIFSIGIILLVFLITSLILKRRKIKNSESWALLASFIYAILPITVQNSILVDIDGGLLNFTVLLFLYFYISNKNFFYLSVSLFFIFASKMLAPPILFASLIILNLSKKDFKEILRVIKLFIFSGFMFFFVFFVYTNLFNLQFTRIFSHNSMIHIIIMLFQNTYSVLARSFWGFKIFVYFLTPSLFLLFIFVSFKIIRNLLKKEFIKKNSDILLLWFYAVFTLCFLLIAGKSGWNFTKYHIASVAPIIILVIFFFPKENLKLKNLIFPVIITLIILSLYFTIFLGNPLLPESQARVATTSFSSVLKPILIRAFLYVIIPIPLSGFLVFKIQKNKIFLTLIFLVIFCSIYLSIIQATADYSTHNLYGDKGLEQVLEYMKDVPPNQILAYNHVGYFLGYKESYELSSVYYNSTRLNEILNNPTLKYIILYQKDIDLLNSSLTNFRIDKEIYSYKILKRIQ